MGRLLFEAQGTYAILQVYEDRVVVKHPKWMVKKDRVVPYHQLASVELHDATGARDGYLRLIYPGSGGETALFKASSDENTIVFDRLNQVAFEHAKALIEEKMAHAERAPSDVIETGGGKCPNCGGPNPAGSDTCVYCGTAMGTGQVKKTETHVHISIERGRSRNERVYLIIAIVVAALIYYYFHYYMSRWVDLF